MLCSHVRPACGGTIEKPFGMCNPNYATSVHELLSSRGLCPDADRGCHEHVDRARANAVVNGAGFHVLKEAPGRPRVQCFNSQRLDGCRTQPGANFARSDDEDDGRWLINHKGMNLFLESRARGANASAADQWLARSSTAKRNASAVVARRRRAVEDLALDGDAAGDLDGARLVAAVVEDHLVLDLGLLDERVA